MVETDLAPIDYKTDLASSSSSSSSLRRRRTFQQRAGYRLVPIPGPYGGVIQQTAQAPGGRRKGGLCGDLLVGYLAQMNRAAQAKTDQEPAPVTTNAGYAFGWTQL